MMKRFSSRLTMLAAALAACAGSASAQTTICNVSVPPGTYDNLEVPANTLCELGQFGPGPVIVTGNVTVKSGAVLIVRQFLRLVVNGSVLGTDARTIEMDLGPGQVSILGSVHLTGTTEEAFLSSVSIRGTLSIANSIGEINVVSNDVGGSALVRANTASGRNFINIEANAIGGSLVCMDNTPAPSGDGNTVGGNKVGQCVGL